MCPVLWMCYIQGDVAGIFLGGWREERWRKVASVRDDF